MPFDPPPLPLVVLTGTNYQAGEQYGRLMRAEIDWALANEAAAIQPMLRAIGLTDQAARERVMALASFLPHTVKEEIQGVADGSGHPLASILYHTLIFDILSGAPIGCSQFAVLDGVAANGKILHGHNLDLPYSTIARVMRPTCVVYRLDGQIPYLSVTFWPAALGVCTGMNAAGLSLGITAPVGPRDSRLCYPLTFQNRLLLASASTIDSAVSSLASLERGGNWSLMLAHRSGEARVWEQAGVYHGSYSPENGEIISANHFLVAQQAARGADAITLEMLQEMQVGSHRRFRRLQALIRQHRGDIDIERCVAFLQDCHDPESENAPSMNTICRSDNVLSMVYSPAELTVDLAAGAAPAALGTRRRLRAADLFNDRVCLTSAATPGLSEAALFPMQGVQVSPGRWRRSFRVDEDVYLDEHRVGAIPVLPGAAAIEWLAEVGGASGQGQVAEIHHVSLERFIRVRESRPVDATVTVERDGNIMKLAASADLYHPKGATLQTDVLHYRADVLLGDRTQAMAPLEWSVPRGVDGEIPFSRSYLENGYFWVGPRFRCVDWISYLSDSEALVRLRVPSGAGHFRSIPEARFWVNPFLLDGLFQAAGTLGIRYNLRAPVPRGLERLVLGYVPAAGEPLWCRVSLTREEGQNLYYNFTVWNDVGRICLRAYDYYSVSVDSYTREEQEYLRRSLIPAIFESPRKEGAL